MRGFTGFRTPGGTAREQIAAQQEQVAAQQQQAKAEAMRECSKLADLIGINNYRLWLELTWPNNAQDDCTWQEIYETVHTAIWLGKYQLLSELECTCKPDGDLCKVCRAQARLMA